jgi:phosphoglycerate kinase
MQGIPSIDDLDLKGRTVLLRADLNVPMAGAHLAGGLRIRRLVPTIETLRNAGARVVLLSHFGRPGGKADPDTSLRPVAGLVSEALGAPVTFAADCIGAEAKATVDAMPPGGVCLLENLRFHAGETENDAGFAAALAELGDVYVNDAFSCAHRAHASVEALAHLLPHAAGPGFEAEWQALERALGTPKRPLMAIIGGAKVSTKLAVLSTLCTQADVLAIGGAMANTFLFARGLDVGRSLFEAELADTARNVLDRAAGAGCEVFLPDDVVVASGLAAGVATAVTAAAEVPGGQMILDFGPAAAAALAERLAGCATLVWNGPLGAFEIPPFDAATTTVARAAAKLTAAGTLISVAGGGDTVAALNRAGVDDAFSYVSTAGGAFLDWLAGRPLPGVEALRTRTAA